MPKGKTRLCKFCPEFVETIHDNLINSLWPNRDVITAEEYRNRALIASAVGRPFQSAFQEDIYPSVLEKAAALFHSINADHGFYNGNKRTAVLAFDMFLVANGHYSLVPNEIIQSLAERTASYRERDVSHEQSYREILEVVRPYVITLRALRKEAPVLHHQVMNARRAIRKFPGNDLIDP